MSLRTVVAGREEFPSGHDLPRHRHLHGYAIVLIRGRFEQISYAGRVVVSAGDLLIQPPLDCHANHLLSRGAQILRLPWEEVDDLGGVFELADLDAVVRAAERDVREAVQLARSHRSAAQRARKSDWPDVLADALVAGDVASLAEWAEQRGVARETVSRGFSAAYGVDARRFRVELRAREAWLRIVRTEASLSEIALESGFADQAHMTRAIRALTGLSPAGWRHRRRPAGEEGSATPTYTPSERLDAVRRPPGA